MKTSELIEFISTGEDWQIYRFSAPMDAEYPICTINMATSETNQDLTGTIRNEFITFVISCFSPDSLEAETLSDDIRTKLLTLNGTAGDYNIVQINITNRRTADYFDADLDQIIYNNQFDFICNVK